MLIAPNGYLGEFEIWMLEGGKNFASIRPGSPILIDRQNFSEVTQGAFAMTTARSRRMLRCCTASRLHPLRPARGEAAGDRLSSNHGAGRPVHQRSDGWRRRRGLSAPCRRSRHKAFWRPAATRGQRGCAESTCLHRAGRVNVRASQRNTGAIPERLIRRW